MTPVAIYDDAHYISWNFNIHYEISLWPFYNDMESTQLEGLE